MVPAPTNRKLAYEDDVKFIDIHPLLGEVNENNSYVTFSGTDYGVCTMSTTMAISLRRFQAHAKLYNYHTTLDTGETKNNVEELDLTVAVLPVDKCHRVTAGEIEQRSLSRAFSKKRESRKVVWKHAPISIYTNVSRRLITRVSVKQKKSSVRIL